MNRYLFALMLLLMIVACTKSDKPVGNNPPGGNNPPAATKTSYTVDSASTQPGMIVTLKASGTITKDTCTVQLSGKNVLLVKIDSVHYAFYTPVLSPGKYSLDLTNIVAASNPDVTVRNYASIAKADDVIASVMKNYNDLADSMAKNSINHTVTLADAAFMHQLMEQLAKNMVLCSADEKLLLAYQLQNIVLDPAVGHKTSVDTSYLALKEMGELDEPGNVMTVHSIDGFTKSLKAVASVTAIVVAMSVAGEAATAYAFAAVVVALANYVADIKAAVEANGEAIIIPGVAFDNVSEINPNAITVVAGKTVFTALQASFRTMRTSDVANVLNSKITGFINVLSLLQQRDIVVKQSFEDLKTKFSSFFDKVTGAYTAYVSPILTNAKEKTERLRNEFITVTSVSLPDITVTATDDGINGLKLLFDNAAKNITTETKFNFQLTYTQTAINSKVTFTKQATFTPGNFPVVTTTQVNAVGRTSASTGGIITSDGGLPVLSKGVCYSITANPIPDITNTVPAGTGTNSFLSNITGLQANTTYHVRAFAGNSAGIGYGADLTFKTLNVGIAVLITTDISSITGYSAVSGGNISSDGGAYIFSRGLCWGPNTNPVVTNNFVADAAPGPGSYTDMMTNLTPNQPYHVRAYATNSEGTAYGNDIPFTTQGPLYVGQAYQGGIIAYLLQQGDPGFDATTQHGLIAATNDVTTGLKIPWYNTGAVATGATGTAIGTGSANTSAIISAQGAGTYAASLCRNYKGGGYTDWYLPSKDEMVKVCQNQQVIGHFTTYAYWTSSEIDKDRAWGLALNVCSTDMFYKDGGGDNIFVRPMRSF